MGGWVAACLFLFIQTGIKNRHERRLVDAFPPPRKQGMMLSNAISRPACRVCNRSHGHQRPYGLPVNRPTQDPAREDETSRLL